MKLVDDWAKEPMAMLGVVFDKGERGQSVHLNKRELAALHRAQEILAQLRLATDPYENGDYGDYTSTTEAVTTAECFLGNLLEEYPSGVFRCDLLDTGRTKVGTK